ncbi:MAG: translation initiation factor IF-2 subunit beta [Candidatus Micrarchaeota archaeon]|nr:translation initiation factor IF-2 subunit beta [Candidatus Micrarchaeota archaeon]MDE1833951.1 translation initiation factor IF-2 subunit beta [Candidatus Micrarchaeota archaeon]MDE1859827.1 translation initiation factor IF-2 subunit beta [Candidatus Micrarchaeota archaeon]
MTYEQLLDRAFSQLPGLSEEKVDFKIPQADVMIQGNKTMVRNIAQIADVARRSKEEIAKYLTKELAAPVTFDNQNLIVLTKIQSGTLNEKIKRFFELYIICKECHKPDTHVQMIDRGYTTIVCEACGAKYTVKNS